MRYLLLYRGYPRKSIKDATSTQIKKMPEDERAKYIQIPMTGTLEEVVKNYIDENKIRRSKAVTLALGLGLDPDKVLREYYAGPHTKRHDEGWTSITSVIGTSTRKRIEAYRKANGIKSTSEAVDRLITAGLDAADGQ